MDGWRRSRRDIGASHATRKHAHAHTYNNGSHHHYSFGLLLYAI